MEQASPNTALLVMDMQQGILDMLPEAATIISQVGKAIARARSRNIPVIYVVVGMRQGAPEINSRNKGFAASRTRFASLDMAAFMKVHPDLAPAGAEVTVVKRRVSAFSGSDLEIVLKAFDIQHLVLTGIATSGVVLSTLREASDKDYELTVLANCCADREEDVHQLLTTKVFPRQAEVIMLEEWN